MLLCERRNHMELTREQQAILDGSQGEVYAKIMKTLVMYGETFGATKMVPVTSTYGHIVTSFGVIVIKGVFDLMDELIAAGVTSKQKFSADPRPVDKNVPSNLLQDIVFKVMYGPQKRYEEQLKKIGLLRDDAFTCACYFPEVGNRPNKGDILSWAESSAVNYANSVLGARCNRNSGIIEMFGSILGFVPYFGLLTDEGRKASWIVEINTTKKPEAQLLGSAIGMKVMEDVLAKALLPKRVQQILMTLICKYKNSLVCVYSRNNVLLLSAYIQHLYLLRTDLHYVCKIAKPTEHILVLVHNHNPPLVVRPIFYIVYLLYYFIDLLYTQREANRHFFDCHQLTTFSL